MKTVSGTAPIKNKKKNARVQWCTSVQLEKFS